MDYERFVLRERAIIFNDRIAASSHAVFQIVREFFDPRFLLHQVEFDGNLCWMGFRPEQTGDEDRGWIKIESGLGAKAPEDRLYRLLDIPPIEVGSVSIRSLSPVASRVLIRSDCTPEALSNLFNGLAQYLVWVVDGEDARVAWSRAVSGDNIKLVRQIDSREIPLLKAPSKATEQIRNLNRPSTGQTPVQKSKKRTKRRKTRERPRAAKESDGQRAKHRIYLPTNPSVLEKWRKMWRIIRRIQREYLKRFNSAEGERPNPTLDELRDAIAARFSHKPSEKTVRRVIQAGSNRLLSKH